VEGAQRVEDIADERFICLTTLGDGRLSGTPLVAPAPPHPNHEESERSDRGGHDFRFHELQVCHYLRQLSPR
jgi:hypothetical protein